MRADEMYVVTRGRCVGIFYSWEKVYSVTNGYPNNYQRKIESVNEGYKILIEHLEAKLESEGLTFHEKGVLKGAKEKYDSADDINFPALF